MKKLILVCVILFSIAAVTAQTNLSTAMQYYKRGLTLVQKQNFTEAINLFDKSIKENPKLGIAYYQRGLAKIKANAKEKATKYVDACADFDKAQKYGYKVPAKYRKQAGCSGK